MDRPDPAQGSAKPKLSIYGGRTSKHCEAVPGKPMLKIKMAMQTRLIGTVLLPICLSALSCDKNNSRDYDTVNGNTDSVAVATTNVHSSGLRQTAEDGEYFAVPEQWKKDAHELGNTLSDDVKTTLLHFYDMEKHDIIFTGFRLGEPFRAYYMRPDSLQGFTCGMGIETIIQRYPERLGLPALTNASCVGIALFRREQGSWVLATVLGKGRELSPHLNQYIRSDKPFLVFDNIMVGTYVAFKLEKEPCNLTPLKAFYDVEPVEQFVPIVATKTVKDIARFLFSSR